MTHSENNTMTNKAKAKLANAFIFKYWDKINGKNWKYLVASKHYQMYYFWLIYFAQVGLYSVA